MLDLLYTRSFTIALGGPESPLRQAQAGKKCVCRPLLWCHPRAEAVDCVGSGEQAEGDTGSCDTGTGGQQSRLSWAGGEATCIHPR